MPGNAGQLDWVGMDEIAVPVRLAGGNGDIVQSPARVAAYVNLKRADVRGIHMSRLYLHVDRHLSSEPLTPCSLRRLLRDFLDSHADLSDRARISVRFDHMVRRPALASDNSGWKTYPVVDQREHARTVRSPSNWRPRSSIRAPVRARRRSPGS